MIDEVRSDGIRTDAKRLRVIRIVGGIGTKHLSFHDEGVRLTGIAEPESKVGELGCARHHLMLGYG